MARRSAAHDKEIAGMTDMQFMKYVGKSISSEAGKTLREGNRNYPSGYHRERDPAYKEVDSIRKKQPD